MNLSDCTVCPRECHVDRNSGQTGYCGQTSDVTVARTSLHMWEEPCISGTNGSGAVFLCGCNLRCIFCQNYAIAHKGNATGSFKTKYKTFSASQLAEIYLKLQEDGAHNINLVTPTHYIPQIIESLESAKRQGLKLPVVYNTGSYEKTDSIKALEGYIDIYLPDLKYYSSDISKNYSNAPDYFDYASAAITEMFRQVGSPVFETLPALSEHAASGNVCPNDISLPDISEISIMKRGVIVRHLLLPGCIDDSRRILNYLYKTYKNNIYMSIMNQYTPMPQTNDIPNLHRTVTAQEYDALIDYAISLGIENAFIQEDGAAVPSYIPDF